MSQPDDAKSSKESSKVNEILEGFSQRLNDFAIELKERWLETDPLSLACSEFMAKEENEAARHLIRRIMLTKALSTPPIQDDFIQIINSNPPSKISEYRVMFTKYYNNILGSGEYPIKYNPGSLDNPAEHLASLYALSKLNDPIGQFAIQARHYVFKVEGLGTYTNFVEAFISRFTPIPKDILYINYNDVREMLKSHFESELRHGGVVFNAMHVDLTYFKANESKIYGTGPFKLSEDVRELLSTFERGKCPAYQTMADGSRRRIVSVLTEMFIDCIPDQVIQNLMISRET